MWSLIWGSILWVVGCHKLLLGTLSWKWCSSELKTLMSHRAETLSSHFQGYNDLGHTVTYRERQWQILYCHKQLMKSFCCYEEGLACIFYSADHRVLCLIVLPPLEKKNVKMNKRSKLHLEESPLSCMFELPCSISIWKFSN